VLVLFFVKHDKLHRGRPSREAIYERLREAVTELSERMGGLPSPLEAEDIWASIWHQEAHHSTALEGNTLALHQVASLLEEGMALGNKELREYVEVTGYAQAAKWVYEQARDPQHSSSGAPITLTEVRYVHELVLGPVWDIAPHPNATVEERPGSFRRHEIKAFPGGMKPPSWIEVNAAMTDWVAVLADLQPATFSVEVVAEAHASFERIHPFLDGNGRTGRLLTNLVLVRMGYPPAIIYTRDRARYLRALQAADRGDAGPLGELFARSITDNLYRFILPAVAAPDALVPLTALASEGRSVAALRAAIERGRLRAHKGTDGQWRSSESWLNEYLQSKHQRHK